MNQILPDDIQPLPLFLENRTIFQKEILAVKKQRRLQVGPFMTVLFENKKTLLWQIQEMVRIEKGGAEQILDEIEAYTPMIPQMREIVATLLIEIDDPELRKHLLGQLGHVDEKVSLEIGEESIFAKSTDDHPRTTEEGKTSAVHFIKFFLTPDQMKNFEDLSEKVILKVAHPHYDYAEELPNTMRTALIEDLKTSLGKDHS
ncbi:DUF3501 domain-containing protein [Candidatus Bealeia paramacronuclearis]|uniref:DUF3501 domain-containing protein n=1 Tax=Candidatus Bealeia paramacronuclearis TaxID=1921001 RepID=A0ABZ2C176_9PROT|nr:hypothetical protein [Candidatus Bealeia paramacronuclearis]